MSQREVTLVRKVLVTQRPTPGQLAVVRSVREDGVLIAGPWFDCRELWHAEYKGRNDVVLIAHKAGHHKRLRAFISLAEELLGASSSDIAPTQRKTITCIVPSDFWWSIPIRRSLFSILLRCGLNYEGDFDEALLSNSHALETKEAIERFFGGHTYYNGKQEGWCDQFRGVHTKRLRRLLT